MTRKEAIKWLKTFKGCTGMAELSQAFDVAIETLEQQSVLDKIKAEITDWQNDIHDNEYDAEKHDFVFERIYEIIDEYKEESEVNK